LVDATSNAPAPPRPRPDRGEVRRQAFLAAAREVFLEQGFEAANVNDVVRLAGGSMATLYAQFGNKEGLFLAVARDQHEQLVAAMTPTCVDHLPVEKGLQVIGEQFITALLKPDSLSFFRIIVGEGRKFPQLLQRYISAAANRTRDVVANHIRHTAPDIANPDRLASYFLELLRSRHHYRALADETYVLSADELRAHVRGAVRFFLAGARATN
jgi:AcrR family transcriptional regulator